MPTAGGRLRAGDRLERRGSLAEYIVTDRLGLEGYHVRVCRADGFRFPNKGGDMVTSMIIINAHTIMTGRNAQWRLLGDTETLAGDGEVVSIAAWLRRKRASRQ
jgi:hypothetical protein